MGIQGQPDSAGYEKPLRQARETAIGEMVAEAEQLGADAVVGVDVSITNPKGKVCLSEASPLGFNTRGSTPTIALSAKPSKGGSIRSS
jgi:uncharacterized protein YbjQ (UPF0145 family)